MFTVCTIGYEGATVASFREALRQAGVDLLVDVRAVAMSRRPGFADVGVDYLQLRRLGTPSDGRAAARAGHHAEMRRIFLEHLATDEAQAELHVLADIVRGGRQVVLLCFEADPSHCHRAIVADALAALVPIEIRHLAPIDDDVS
jgi:uncharacterized protein (DUF488 family)